MLIPVQLREDIFLRFDRIDFRTFTQTLRAVAVAGAYFLTKYLIDHRSYGTGHPLTVASFSTFKRPERVFRDLGYKMKPQVKMRPLIVTLKFKGGSFGLVNNFSGLAANHLPFKRPKKTKLLCFLKDATIKFKPSVGYH